MNIQKASHKSRYSKNNSAMTSYQTAPAGQTLMNIQTDNYEDDENE